VLIIVVPSAVLIRHVDADALGDHLAQRLRLPARTVVVERLEPLEWRG